MATVVQSPWLGMVALGDNTAADPNKGNHLRWAFEPRLGFPAGGFDLYRRPHFTAPPVCVTLQGFTANSNLGKRVTLRDVLLESADDIRTVELAPAGGAPEIDLRNNRPLQIFPREVCHRVRVYVVDLNPAGGSIQATAYDGNVPVSSNKKTVASPNVQYLDLTADRIDRVVVRDVAGPMNGVLTQVCYTTVAADAHAAGWMRLNQGPICLPLSEQNYAAPCSLPNQAQEWPTAQRRIPAKVRPKYDPAVTGEFTHLRNTLGRIYNPSGALLTTTDTPCPPASGSEGTPKFVHDPLGVVLLATLEPNIARMLGLYWIDGSFYADQGLQGPAAAAAGTTYDYMITAHYPDPPQPAGVCDIWDADVVGTSVNGKVPHGPLTYTSSVSLTVVQHDVPDFDVARGLSIPYNLNRPLRIALLEPAQAVELYVDVPDANARAIARAFSKGVEVDTAVRPASANGPTILLLSAEAIDAVELEGSNVFLTKTCYYTDYPPGGDMSFVTYNIVLGSPDALPAPSRLSGDSLPVLTRLDSHCAPVTAQMAAGLRWERGLAGGHIVSGGAVLFDIQRQALGNGNLPGAISPAAWESAKTNILVASPPEGSQCEPYEPLAGWSHTRPDHIDAPPSPQQRWYAYRVRGRDIFGRESAYREAAPIDLADIVPPPPPADVYAKYLDPDDPFLAPDERAWTHPNGDSRPGLRVGWRWTGNLQLQAPDAAQFRVYLKTGRLNVVMGRITAFGELDADGNIRLITDVIAAGLPSGDVANAFRDEWLSQSGNLYQVLSSDSSDGFLALRFKRIVWVAPSVHGVNIIHPELQPIPAKGAFSLSVRQSKRLAGTITASGWPNDLESSVSVDTDVRYPGAANDLAGKKLRQGGRLWDITGNSSGWKFQMFLRARACEPAIPVQGQQFSVVAVDGVTPLLIDEGNPHWRDYRDPRNWDQRLRVEPRIGEPAGLIKQVVHNANRTSTVTTDHHLDDASDHYLGGELEAGNYSWPVIGHTTGEDFQLTVLNNQRDRSSGAVQPVAPPANVAFTYWPDIVIPVSPLDIQAGHPTATAAVGVSAADDKTYAADPLGDGGGQPGNEGRVSAPVMISRPDRSVPPACTSNTDVLMASPADYFGHSYYTVRWSRVDDDAAPGVSYQIFRTLAEPDGSEPAGQDWPTRYRLLTPEPLRPDDDKYRDVAEPGHAPADPALIAYKDTLDGKSTSRYYYRVRAINAAGTRGPWSDSIGPVACPDVVPPRAPVITKVLGGDRQITLKWASNREPDLAEYRVYRADGQEAASDLRSMTLVHVEAEAREPGLRPAEATWVDESVPGLLALHYRLAAVDQAGNVSGASQAVSGRAFDATPPEPPAWEQSEWVSTEEGLHLVRLVWSANEPGMRCIVQRKATNQVSWRVASDWLSEPAERRGPPAAWVFVFQDTAVKTGKSYEYRIKAVTRSGNANRTYDIARVPALDG